MVTDSLARLQRLLRAEGVYATVALQLIVDEVDALKSWAEMVLRELPAIERSLEDSDWTSRSIEMVKATKAPTSEEYLKAEVMEQLLSNPDKAREKIAALRRQSNEILGKNE